MKRVPTFEELLQIVRHYYPAGLESYDPRYEMSPERQRLQAVVAPERLALEQGRKDTKWACFKKKLHAELPESIWDTSLPLYDPCHRVRVGLPDNPEKRGLQGEVVGLISLLAPVYAIYVSHEFEDGVDRHHWVRFSRFPADFREREAWLAERIEEEYGFVRLPRHILFVPVPDFAPEDGLMLGEAYLIDLLFTRQRW